MPMMIPIIAAAAPYVAAAGAVVSAYGAYQQGQQAKKVGEFNANIANQNAGIAKADADAAASQQDRESRLRLGAIRANMGASGGTGAGSALDVLGDVASQGALQTQFARYQGAQQARGFNNTSALDSFEGSAAGRAGTMKAAGSLLSGIGTAYGQYSNLTTKPKLTQGEGAYIPNQG